MATCDNVIVEQTFVKNVKNFPYLNKNHYKNYFNDFVNQHSCNRKSKKVRLFLNQLPQSVHLK